MGLVRFLSAKPRALAFCAAAVAVLLVAAGCDEEDRDPPTPLPQGTANGLPTEPVAPDEVITLDGGTLTPPAGLEITQITWNWGDGATDTSSHTDPVTHSYEDPGYYTLTITVTYNDSRSVSWQVEIAVFDDGALAVKETARGIPMAYNVDVVVVGGSTGAVSAAVAAAGEGASVFLAAPRPYLGEDMCAHHRMWLEGTETAGSPMTLAVFASAGPQRPLHVKKTLDLALETADVEFLYGSYATELLRDGDGKLAGIVIANRTGRQAVVAKVIIDATDRAWVARMAGATFAAYPAGPQDFMRVVIDGPAKPAGAGISVETMAFPIDSRAVHRYTLTIDMPDGSWPSFAEAEQVARDMTFDAAQADESERLFQVPPDPMTGVASEAGAWPGAAAINLDVFRPAGVDRLYVLGGCADVTRAAAAEFLRPIELIDTGTRIGEAAAAEAALVPALAGVKLPGGEAFPVSFGEVQEKLAGVRPTDPGLPAVPAEARGLPVIGEYDVVVIGGGTGGAPAGIGAGRQGAKALVVEYQNALGGVGTVGLIGMYYKGYKFGFWAELEGDLPTDHGKPGYVVEKMEWWRTKNREAGTVVWFGALGCGAFVEAGVVKGAIVATPEGRGVVLAKVVVDSTGNSDIAAAAGAACTYTGGEHVGVQGTGLPPRALRTPYTNTDYTFGDDTDVTDFWHLYFWAREKYSTAYDLGQLVDTRERRRIVGDFTMSPMDIFNGRTYPDTIVRCRSNFDSHGFAVHPFFMILPPDDVTRDADVPYRCLLPAGLDGILVTGLGISAHRDAMPVIRMQPGVQNQGYAAGYAAATAAGAGVGTRDIDIKVLQEHLVDIGNLTVSVLTDTDPYPYSTAQIQEAVNSLTASPGVIVDDADGAPAFVTTGTWLDSVGPVGGYYGINYKHNDQDPTSTATFTPDLPDAGTYDVYLRWTAHSNRETEVPVTVNHPGGPDFHTVDQTQNGGQWNLLGTYDFPAGQSGSVVVAAKDDAGHVIADAVRFAAPGAGGLDPVVALGIMLTDTATAIPMLQAKHGDAGTHPDGKVVAAHILGMLGDATGAATLAAKVASYAAWDTGWNYKGMGQYGASISTLDSYIIALGRTKNAAVALTPILDKVALLDAGEEFSHHRAVAIALETLGSPAAAVPLADVLAKANMTGHHVTNMTEARDQYNPGTGNDNVSRNESLRELVLARALFRCGDSGGVGRAILESYAQDLRGHYSRHARAVLAGE